MQAVWPLCVYILSEWVDQSIYQIELFFDTSAVESLKKELRELKDKSYTLTELILASGVDPDLVARRKDMVALIQSIEAQLAQIENDAPDFSLDGLVDILREDAERLEFAPREIILRYVHSILVYDDHIDITWAPNYLNNK